MTFRPSKLEPWQVRAATKLKQMVDDAKIRQELFIEAGLGSQGHVSQLLTKKRPISEDAAAKFAGVLGCKVDDFSPELAAAIRTRIETLAAHVRWPDESIRAWPLSVPRHVFNRLSDEARRKINQYVVDQTLIEGVSDDKSDEDGSSNRKAG